MSVKISPGGALLRTSRMFSLPKPIPNAKADSTLGRDPSRGTNHHPTHQAITTFGVTRKVGDWGLKRPLPLKTTTKTATPAVQVRQMDSCEMITDFATASQHTITIQKFQELGLPLTVPSLPNTFMGISPENVSVFEEDSDFIAKETAEGEPDNSKRWKFNGPWLAGLSEGGFNAYIRRTVRPRRAEFRQFMKQRMAADVTAANRQAALDKGEEPVVVNVEDITEEQFTTYVRKLRAERIALFSMVSDFLDLAPVSPPSAVSSMTAGSRVQAKSPNPYAERGPPSSHPSGGLSYLRTASYAENHPIYGPQAQRAPALGRIIMPRQGSQTAKVGLGGFITDAPQGDSAWNARPTRTIHKAKTPGVAWFDPKIPGGPKAYVAPRTATIHADGKLMIKIDEADEMAQLIAKELIGEAEIYNKPAPAPEERTPRHRQPRSSFRLGEPRPQVNSSSQTYGLDV